MERENTDDKPEENTSADPIPLQEPEIEQEIANSDEYMQKGLRDEED